MNDKQQIEEIAEWICSYNCDRSTCFGGCEKCDNYKLANNLYEQGYRKLPENAVVLTKEEYDEIKQYQSYIPELKKAFDKVRNATAEMYKDECEYWKSRCEEIGNVASKETAREILRRFVEFSENPCNSREDILEELARQFGVEVKE